jgi:hypothetical protein
MTTGAMRMKGRGRSTMGCTGQMTMMSTTSIVSVRMVNVCAVSKKTEMKTRNMTGQKLNYILDEALADLGLRNVLSVEFWLSLFVLFLAMWYVLICVHNLHILIRMRLYLHFFGQWLLLKFAGIPVTKFVPYL